MKYTNATELPLEAAAGVAEPQTVGAFKHLSDESRLAILPALWEAYEPFADNNALSFSELREQVEYETSGNFSYHLEKL